MTAEIDEPIHSNEPQIGDEIVTEFCSTRLHELGGEIMDLLGREKDRKACHCSSCTHNREKQARMMVEDFNFLYWIAHPECIGKSWLSIESDGKTWELIGTTIKGK